MSAAVTLLAVQSQYPEQVLARIALAKVREQKIFERWLT